MIQYKGTDIHSGKPVAGWYVRANHAGEEVHIIIEDMSNFDGDNEFWTLDVHEVDPNTLVVLNDCIVFCKDCMSGRKKHFPRMGETVECQKYHHDDPRQYKDLFDYCSQGVRRDEDDG